MVDVDFLEGLNNMVYFEGMNYFILTCYIIGYDRCNDCYSRCNNCEFNDRIEWWNKVV